MPRALDRLLASPSALRALRNIVATPELPAIWIPSHDCCHPRAYSSSQKTGQDIRKSPREPTDVGRRSPPNPSSLRKRIHPDIVRKVQARPIKLDEPEDPNDHGTWVRWLQYQERVFGVDGVRQTWVRMKERQVELPTAGRNADLLWGILMQNAEMLEDVIAYAGELQRNTRIQYEPLYRLCMTKWIMKKPEIAYKLHVQLVEQLHLRNLPLAALAQMAAKNPASLGVFRRIYKASKERNIYDSLIPALVKQGNMGAARKWHALLLRRNDLPTQMASEPLTTMFTHDSSSPFEWPIRKDERTTTRSRFWHTKVTRKMETAKSNFEFMNELIGEAHRVEPKRFDDAFCARLFATKAFTPTAVIKGLGMFGVEAIGPVALREMGLRANSTGELQQLFKEIKDTGIAITKSVFSRVLQKFAFQGNFSLVRDLLESDQHPDVLEDSEIQKELLKYYISRGDWTQVHRTLVILTIYHKDPLTSSWNKLLQYRSKHMHLEQVAQLLQDMRDNGIPLGQSSTRALLFDLLRERRPSKRPVTFTSHGFDDLRFLSRIWLMVLESGELISPERWREIVRRFGMTGRLKELRRLIYRLLRFYSPLGKPYLTPAGEQLSYATTRAPTDPWHPLQRIFPPSFQSALIEWGFKTGLSPSAPYEISMISPHMKRRHYRQRYKRQGLVKRIEYTIGIQTLAQMRDAGVAVHPDLVRKTVKRRLYILYGPGRISNRRENRVARAKNTIEPADMVREVEKAWGSKLFDLPGINEPFEEPSPTPPVQEPVLEEISDVGTEQSDFFPEYGVPPKGRSSPAQHCNIS